MARPITWQNVNSPQGAASIEALLRSGRQAGAGFEGMGDVFRTARDEMQQAATGAAVAQIANSQDPLAAAAAAPKTWQFDPLAISAAANAREGQLFDRTVKESDLRENELNIKNTESLLADRESMRQIATMIAPYEALARAGKDFDVDEDSSPFWKTPAGFEAKKHLEGLKNTAFNQRIESQKAAAAARQAKAAEDAYNLTLKQQQAADAMAAWRHSPDGSAAVKGAVLDQAMKFGKEFGVGEAFALTLADKYGSDAYRGTASREQLESLAPGGMSYITPITALQAKNSQQVEEFNKRDQQRKAVNAAVTALGDNNYAGMAPARINNAILERNKDNISFWQGAGDMQQRRDLQVSRAKDEVASVARELGIAVPEGFQPLTPEQEAQLVELTLQTWELSDRFSSDNDAATSLRRDYIRYNLLGGDKNFEKRAADDAAAVQRTIERNNELILQTEAAGRKGTEIPKAAFDFAVKQYRPAK